MMSMASMPSKRGYLMPIVRLNRCTASTASPAGYWRCTAGRLRAATASPWDTSSKGTRRRKGDSGFPLAPAGLSTCRGAAHGCITPQDEAMATYPHHAFLQVDQPFSVLGIQIGAGE
jgi:hypothetical protein